jgi:hypothetical protein
MTINDWIPTFVGCRANWLASLIGLDSRFRGDDSLSLAAFNIQPANLQLLTRSGHIMMMPDVLRLTEIDNLFGNVGGVVGKPLHIMGNTLEA